MLGRFLFVRRFGRRVPHVFHHRSKVRPLSRCGLQL
jgi:hypothetical protein